MPCKRILILGLYDPNGSVVSQSSSYDNNYETVEYLADIAGDYRIRISRSSSYTRDEYIGLAWNVVRLPLPYVYSNTNEMTLEVGVTSTLLHLTLRNDGGQSNLGYLSLSCSSGLEIVSAGGVTINPNTDFCWVQKNQWW